MQTNTIPSFYFLCSARRLNRISKEHKWSKGYATEETHVEYDSDEDYLRTSSDHLPNFSNISTVKPALLRAIYKAYLETEQ